MRKSSFLFLSAALASVALLRVSAQEPPAKPVAAPRDLTLEMLRVADSNPPQSLRILTERGRARHNQGYRTLASPTLKEVLKSYPKDTTISWYADCIGPGVRPTREELAEFGAYCRSIGLKFVIVPAS